MHLKCFNRLLARTIYWVGPIHSLVNNFLAFIGSGVARMGKLGHAPWGTGRGGASARFLQSFQNAF